MRLAELSGSLWNISLQNSDLLIIPLWYMKPLMWWYCLCWSCIVRWLHQIFKSTIISEIPLSISNWCIDTVTNINICHQIEENTEANCTKYYSRSLCCHSFGVLAKINSLHVCHSYQIIYNMSCTLHHGYNMS